MAKLCFTIPVNLPILFVFHKNKPYFTCALETSIGCLNLLEFLVNVKQEF